MNTQVEPKTQLLTFSRTDAFKSCRRKAYFNYEIGVRPEVDARALRMGTAFHSALECLGNGGTLDEAITKVYDAYVFCPNKVEEYDWRVEEETVCRMVCGYSWHWQNSGIEYLAAEQSFELPLVNPETGRPTPNWNLAGKIDGIIKLPDGRLAVLETKLLGDDIGSDAPMWRLMRRSHQVSIYVMAARQLGYAVDTVLYNVARKPTIKPTAIPELDDMNCKIVIDPATNERVYNKNGSPRQTGDTEKGYVVVQRAMTIQEWGEKLNNDIAERPAYYFQRVEIPRLDDDLQECAVELWEIQKTIRDAQVNNRWFRTVNRNTCQFCSFDPICDRKDIRRGSALPEGFVFVDDVHPELERSL